MLFSFQAYFLGLMFDILQQLNEILFVPTYYHKVIHPPDVKAEAALFLNVVIKGIQHEQSKELRGLVSQGQALCLVDVDTKQVIDAHIQAALLENLEQLAFEHIVVDAGKEVMNIALEYPALCGAVLCVVAHHAGFEPDNGVRRPFSGLVRAVVSHKAARYGVVQAIVCNSMEDNLILERRGLNIALFRLENLEALELSRPVCSGCRSSMMSRRFSKRFSSNSTVRLFFRLPSLAAT